MPAPRVRADRDQLAQIATQFGRQASDANKSLKRIKGQVDSLQGGDWIGKGATAFYREMDSEVLPSLTRLAKALDEAQKITNQISKIMQGAEDDAARILGAILGAAMAGAAGAGAASGADGAGGAAAAGGDSIATGWIKKAINLAKGAKWTLHGLSGYPVAAAKLNAVREAMAEIFARGGEQAIRSSGIHKIAADRMQSLAKINAGWLQRLSKAAGITGVGLTAGKQALDSSAETFLGKMASSGLSGTFSYATKGCFPLYAADAALNSTFGVSPVRIFNGAYDSLAVVGEGLITGESGGMARLHERQLAGDWGPFMREVAEAGDFWAEHGVVAPMKELWNAGTELFR